MKKIMTSELAIMIILGVLAATGVTRPTPPPVQIVVVGSKAQVPAVQATIYSADWCEPCKKYVMSLESMKADDWRILPDTDKESATAHIVVTKSDKDWQKLKIELLPTTIIRVNGKEVDRFSGAKSPDDLAKLINKHAEKESK
jgi:thioredoxin-like negative regulator of GroEL